MNKDQEKLIEKYIGLSLSAAETIWKLGTGKVRWAKINKNTQDNLNSRSLIVLRRDASKTTEISAELTQRGANIADLYSRIISGSFHALQPALSEKAFKQLDDTQKMARLPIVQDLGLRSVHMKALRMIARIPDVSIIHLDKVFDYRSVIVPLKDKQLIIMMDDCVNVTASERGLNLLRVCAGLE